MASILCVVNRKSRHGIAAIRAEKLLAMCDQMGVHYQAIDLTDSNFKAQFEQQLTTTSVDAVLGVGGDGTHHSVANVWFAIRTACPSLSLPPYALVPCGTGNDIAKSIGLDVSAVCDRSFIEIALHGTVRPLDLGCCNGKYFLDMLSLGLEARILATRDRWQQACVQKRLPRFFGGYKLYAAAGLLDIFRHRAQPCRVRVKDTSWFEGRAVNILVNNCPIHAGEFALTPGCRPDDAKLDLLIASGTFGYLWRLARAFRHNPRFLQPRPGSKRVTQATDIQIETDTPIPWQVDGEYQGTTSALNVAIHPAAFPVRVAGN